MPAKKERDLFQKRDVGKECEGRIEMHFKLYSVPSNKEVIGAFPGMEMIREGENLY